MFAPTLAAGIRTTSVQIASAALATSAVRTAWRQANRVAHDQIVRVLEGKGTVVTTAKGEVAINTGPLAGRGAPGARREQRAVSSTRSRRVR